jgi:hypothetical protein
MSQTRRDEIIADAARRRTPVVLTRHDDGGGWKTYKSRFLGCSERARHLYIEQPGGWGEGPGPTPERGELLGVAFRRGHKKCLFNAMVRSCPGDGPGGAPHSQGFAIGWPDELQELQRRVYQRACPPPDRSIKARFWADPPATGPERARVGILQDLSAGGMRVRCADDAGLEMGDNVKIAFALRSREPRFVLDALYRHCEPNSDGTCSLGFQFLGLETSREGHETLARLARTVTTFQRAAIRRRYGHLRPCRPRG